MQHGIKNGGHSDEKLTCQRFCFNFLHFDWQTYRDFLFSEQMKSRTVFFRSILSCTLVFISMSIHSFARADDFKALYDQGKFSEAYEQLSKSGIKTAADYYNAANCLYRLSKFGTSYAYYQKAQAMQPNNADIRYNLKLAEDALNKTGQLTKDKSFWRGQIVPFSYDIGETVPYLITVLLAAILLVLISVNARKGVFLKSFLTDPAFLALFVCFLASLGCAITVTTALNTKLAVIVSDSSIARSGPSESFTELFRLNAGATVELSGEKREGWSQIKFSLGNIGWIAEKDFLNL